MAVNSSQMKRIYLSPPHLEGDELEFVKDAFASNWIAPVGSHVDAFEREVAEPARLFMKADIPCSLIQTEQHG